MAYVPILNNRQLDDKFELRNGHSQPAFVGLCTYNTNHKYFITI